MPTILQNHHVLAVPDKDAAATFYITRLGFREVHRDEGWVFVQRDRCMLMLGECPDALPPCELGDHNYFAYLVVDDVDAFYAEARANGAELLGEVKDKPWGMREFGVRTPEGYRLMLGQRLTR
jgi:catechol 2,3-dioxygenase-like lactoylglutathione lyase family enzyme